MKTAQTTAKKKPRTAKQIEASRRNGRKSKGPVTEAGKKKSSRNAVKHSLFCQVFPEGPMPVFADSEEYVQMVEKFNADFGISTELGRRLVESLALDTLRLRHAQGMLVTTIDPGIKNDKNIEAALLQKEFAYGTMSEQDIYTLWNAYLELQAQLTDGKGMHVQEDAVELITADIWQQMSRAKPALDAARKELARLDATLGENPNPVQKSRREQLLMKISDIEYYVQHTDKEIFNVRSEADLKAFITGKKRLTQDRREKWIKLIGICKGNVQSAVNKIRKADETINARKQECVRESVLHLETLQRLGEYQNQTRRSIAKTMEMIRDVEKMAVIDVLD
jgi:hypothetical protein